MQRTSGVNVVACIRSYERQLRDEAEMLRRIWQTELLEAIRKNRITTLEGMEFRDSFTTALKKLLSEFNGASCDEDIGAMLSATDCAEELAEQRKNERLQQEYLAKLRRDFARNPAIDVEVEYAEFCQKREASHQRYRRDLQRRATVHRHFQDAQLDMVNTVRKFRERLAACRL
jgi:hypothetical protein